jgi:hypothetical protein
MLEPITGQRRSGDIMSKRPGLSKSRITAFEQCPKRLWLSVHRPELGAIDSSSKARLAAGNDVGTVACELHPEGVMVEAEPNLTAALETTAALLAQSHPGPIFEATFQHEGVLIRADIISRDGEGQWQLAEVKSSTGPKEYHIGDLATQVWVMEAAGISLSGAAVRHLNRAFVLQREGDYTGLFQDAELLELVRPIAAQRSLVAAEARATLAGDEPVREPGDHCTVPFACEFSDYCNSHLPAGPKWPVTVLPNGAGKSWLSEGITDLLELDEAALPEKHARIVRATRSGDPDHDVEGARRAIEGWSYPRAWLDFETIAFAVPRWIGTRPYQQVPFQFSVHVEEADGVIVHHEFLSLDGTDPRRACAEALIAAIPADTTIIAYNAPFEKGVLRDLAALFPDLKAAMLSMAEQTVDLLPVTRNHWYHRDQRGSWSIKAVLPTMTSLDYNSLDVKDGTDAQEAYLEAIRPDTTAERRALLGQSLKEYCAQDTWAMVAMTRFLSAAG